MESVDVLLVSYFEDVDRFHNDLVSGPWTERASGFGGVTGGRVQDARRERQAVRIDGERYDLARFMSWAVWGHTREYRRYDAQTGTHLCGTYLESVLRRRGFTLRHVNHATRFDLAALAERIEPRYLFLSTTFLPEPQNIGEVTKLMQRLWPGVPVILGGQILIEYSKTVPPAVFTHYLQGWGADAVVLSARAEAQSLAIVSSEPDQLPKLQLPVTWLRQADGSYTCSDAPDRAPTVDETAVHWHLLDPEHVYHLAGMRTARSCSFACAFCSHPANNGGFDPVEVATVEAELRWQRELGVVKRINFTDDTFNVPLRRFRKILDLLSRHGFEWGCYFRCQYADEDTVKAMADAGCRSVYLGIESLDDAVLANMDKKSRRQHYESGVRWLRRHGIATHANFVFGFPGEQPDCGERTLQWVDDHGIDFYCASPFYCSPATPVWGRRGGFGLTGRYWGWRHDTMDAHQAMAAEASVIGAGKHATWVSELVAHSGWTAWFMIANGMSIAGVKEVIGLYNDLCGRDGSAAAISAMPRLAEVRRLIQAGRFPQPPDATLTTAIEPAASVD
ncbi:MAG TPA: radical SAM protein [Deltaproteobacteria bacterium]|nr:radical SAM protein [Deltaproteobacteria bacterium]